MYNLSDFGSMMRDAARMKPHIEALRQHVRKDSVVVDLGAGTGILSLIACQLGAKHVYAIEMSPLVELGRSFAAANGYEDRITFIKDMSNRVKLPEKADIIIGDLRGHYALFKHIIPAFADAYQRLLKPEGVIIPKRDLLYITLLDAPELYLDYVLKPWKENNFGLNLEVGFSFQANSPIFRKDSVMPKHIMLPPQLWATIDYGIQTDPNVSNTVNFTAERNGTAHFIYTWFDSEFSNDIGFCNAPSADKNNPVVYGGMMLPLKQPVEIHAGDSVQVYLGATLIGEDYVFHWKALASQSENRTSIQPGKEQSSLFSLPLLNMRKRASNYRPTLNLSGQCTAFILGRMQTQLPLSEIAAQTQAQFPEQFSTYNDALARVADLASRYSN